MKVTYLAWAYPSAAVPQNGTYFRNQTEALAKLGTELTVVSPTPWMPQCLSVLSKRWNDYHANPTHECRGMVDVLWPRYPGSRFTAKTGLTHRLMQRAIGKALGGSASVLHANGAYPLGLAAVEAGKRNRCPVVLTAHGGDVNVIPTLSHRHRMHFDTAVRSATRVVAVSARLANKTEEMTGVRPLVLPIGIDTRRFSRETLPDRASLRRKLGLPLDRTLLLYVGNLIPTKGIGELCQALSAVQDDELACVFVGEGPMRDTVEATPHAIYAGRVENEIVRQYMAAADGLILPSYTEGLPTVVVEAGSMGLPVIATAVGGSAELLADERGVLLPPMNVPALIEALRIVGRNNGLLATLAARLRRHVREQHDIEINSKRLLGVYEDAAAQFTSPAWSCSSQRCQDELVGVGD